MATRSPYFLGKIKPLREWQHQIWILFDHLVHTSSGYVGNLWAQWGRGGSGWADTLGKRSHVLKDGF